MENKTYEEFMKDLANEEDVYEEDEYAYDDDLWLNT